MLKLASARVDSPTKMIFPQPENLLRLARQFRESDNIDEKTRIARRFTQTVAALRVGHICKTTRWGRLDRSLAQLAEILDSNREHQLLDLGVSDGITTLEAIRFMRSRQFNRFTATGIDLHNELVRFQNGFAVEYRSNTGDPVLVKLGPLLLTLGKGASPRQPISRWIADWYLRRWPARNEMHVDVRIPLINPLARECPEISFEVQNVFEPRTEWSNRFTVIRAANVLHREYFSDVEIGRALSQLFGYLREGGILQVSRNLAPRESPLTEEHGSFWLKGEDRFTLISHFGRGSCVAELIDGFRRDEHTPRQRSGDGRASSLPEAPLHKL